MSDLQNQHLLVVGGSSGIGLAVEQAAGARLTLMGRSAERLQAAAAGLGGTGARTLVADVRDEAAVQAALRELAPLRFNAIAPGWTDTPMWDALLGENKAATFTEVAAKLPTGQLATAQQAAEAVLLLMRNAAVNAEVLHVDGGHRLV